MLLLIRILERWTAAETTAVQLKLSTIPKKNWVIAKIQDRQAVDLEKPNHDFDTSEILMSISYFHRNERAMKTFVVCAALSALGVTAHSSDAQQILEVNNDTLTTYQPTAAASVQKIQPQYWQRGVKPDGTMRAGSLQGWALAGNLMEPGTPGQARLGQVDLATGGLSLTEVDIALPVQGAGRWVIGRSYNHLQLNGSSHVDSDGPQGFNWHQMSQPEIVFYDHPSDSAKDTVYIVYGADRFLEFVRTDSSSNYFKGKNGAAGIVEYVAGSPDTYIYHDQNGVDTYFFGDDTGNTYANWQLWKIVGPEGTGSDTSVAYVGDSSSAATAVTNAYYDSGTSSDVPLKQAFDASGRRYTYTYTSFTYSSVTYKRLSQVKAEINTGSWTEVCRVDYAYYESDDSGKGKAGDLKTVSVVTPLTDSGVSLTRTKYYRYYTDAWTNYDGSRGHPHFVKLALGFEGVRYSSSFYTWAFDEDLVPASEFYAEYANSGGGDEYRVSSIFFNGQCGCSGGANGTYALSYVTNSSYSDTAGYTIGWARRVVIEQPDNSRVIQYFDETAQPLSRVVVDRDPTSTAPIPRFWVTEVVRNSAGQVERVYSPASISSYTYSTSGNDDLITRRGSAGLVSVYGRVASGTVAGFIQQMGYQEGDSPANYSLTDYWSYTTRDRTFATGVYAARPVLTEQRKYHTAALTGQLPDQVADTTKYNATAYSYSWWDATAVNADYVALKQITTDAPAISVANNGRGTTSNDLIRSDRYLRKDGSLAFAAAPFFSNVTTSPTKEFTYQQIDSNGLTVKSRRDADVVSGSFPSGDAPSDWGINQSSYGSILPFNQETTYTYDDLGRMTSSTMPNGRTTYTYYSKIGDERTITVNFPRVTGSAPSRTFYGPASFTVVNHAGKSEAQGVIAIASSINESAMVDWIAEYAFDPLGAITSNLGSVARYSTSIYDASGTRLSASLAYHQIPSGSSLIFSSGSVGTNYSLAQYFYDAMGRAEKTIDQTGTITRTVFDEIGRPVARWIGTDDTSFDPALGGGNMTKISITEYDSGGVGNSLVTKTQSDPDGTWSLPNNDVRTLEYIYDFRNRLKVQINPTAPHTLLNYDNLGRQTHVAQYSISTGLDASDDPSSLTANRVALMSTNYDEQGHAWKIIRYEIVQSGASAGTTTGNPLVTYRWFDTQSRIIKEDGDSLTKIYYDRLGRTTNRFVLAQALAFPSSSGGNYTREATNYSQALDVTYDIIVEESQNYYAIDSNNILMSVRLDRKYGDFRDQGQTNLITFGALDQDADLSLLDFTGSKVKGRPQITTYYYDEQDRLVDTVQLGTNGDTNFDRDTATTPPSRSSTVLRTTTCYNSDGTIDTVEDPRGLKSKTLYDDLGQKIATIANWTNATPPLTTTNRDSDIYTRYVYTNSQMTKMWVDLNGDNIEDADDQVTQYVYDVQKTTNGVIGPNSHIAAKNLLSSVIYPPGQASSLVADRTVKFAYDAMGEQIWTEDQMGTVITQSYDAAGRLTAQSVPTIVSPSIDTSVRRIEIAYDYRGLPTTLSQYDAATSGSLVNQVQQSYNNWGQLAEELQDTDGAVGGTDDYRYTLSWSVSVGGGIPDILSQTGYALYQTSSGTSVMSSGFSFSSPDTNSPLRRVYSQSLPVPGVFFSSIYYVYGGLNRLEGRSLQYGSSVPIYNVHDDPILSNAYSGFDRFDRPIRSEHWKTLNNSRRYYYNGALEYDQNSNITLVDEDTSSSGTAALYNSRDVQYTIDGLNRVTQATEGTWNGSSISSNARNEAWTLTQTGNWYSHNRDLNGDADYNDSQEYSENRTHSNANEMTERNLTGGIVATYSPSYNARGDMIDDGQAYKFEYDAFGRLRRIMSRDTTALISEYTYDALGRRVGWHYDVDASGTVNSSDPWYYFAYDNQWRIVATFRGADTKPKEIVYYEHAGLASGAWSSYIDSVAMIQRDMTNGWDGAADGVYEQRYYPLQNWRGDVVAVADTGGALLESIRYSSYGTPTLLPTADYDRDGDVDLDDIAALQSGISNQDVRADANWDGVMDSTDETFFISSLWANADASGWFSTSGNPLNGRGHLSLYGLRKGYAGYENDGVLTRFSHVRHRVYDAELGRWTRRDPIGNVDGPSLYEYCNSRPIGEVDPSGLMPHVLLVALVGCGLSAAASLLTDWYASYVGMSTWNTCESACSAAASCAAGALLGAVLSSGGAALDAVILGCITGAMSWLAAEICKQKLCGKTSVDMCSFFVSVLVGCISGKIGVSDGVAKNPVFKDIDTYLGFVFSLLGGLLSNLGCTQLPSRPRQPNMLPGGSGAYTTTTSEPHKPNRVPPGAPGWSPSRPQSRPRPTFPWIPPMTHPLLERPICPGCSTPSSPWVPIDVKIPFFPPKTRLYL